VTSFEHCEPYSPRSYFSFLKDLYFQYSLSHTSGEASPFSQWILAERMQHEFMSFPGRASSAKYTPLNDEKSKSPPIAKRRLVDRFD